MHCLPKSKSVHCWRHIGAGARGGVRSLVRPPRRRVGALSAAQLQGRAGNEGSRVPSTWAQHGEQRRLDIKGAGVGAVCVTATGGHDAGGKPNRVAGFSKEKKPLVVAFFEGEERPAMGGRAMVAKGTPPTTCSRSLPAAWRGSPGRSAPRPWPSGRRRPTSGSSSRPPAS